MLQKGRSATIWISVLLLIIVLVALPASTYKFRAAELVFQTVSRQMAYTGGQDMNPRIQILTEPSASAGLDVLAEDRSQVQEVDYSQYLVLVVFFGYGSSDQSEVTKIAQFKDVVWIRSYLPTPPADAAKTSPYQILTIKTAQFSQFGQNIFKLVNEVFVDKAKMIQTVLPPVS